MKQECVWKETEKRNHILEDHNLIDFFFSCPLQRPTRIGYKIRIIYKKMTWEAILFTYQFVYQIHVSRFQGKTFGDGGHDGCPSLLPVAVTKTISESILRRKGFCSSDRSQVTVHQWGKSGQGLRQQLKQHGGMLLTSFLPLTGSACFPCTI